MENNKINIPNNPNHLINPVHQQEAMEARERKERDQEKQERKQELQKNLGEIEDSLALYEYFDGVDIDYRLLENPVSKIALVDYIKSHPGKYSPPTSEGIYEAMLQVEKEIRERPYGENMVTVRSGGGPYLAVYEASGPDSRGSAECEFISIQPKKIILVQHTATETLYPDTDSSVKATNWTKYTRMVRSFSHDESRNVYEIQDDGSLKYSVEYRDVYGIDDGAPYYKPDWYKESIVRYYDERGIEIKEEKNDTPVTPEVQEEQEKEETEEKSSIAKFTAVIKEILGGKNKIGV